MLPRRFHNRIHLTANTGIVDRHDNPGIFSDSRFNQTFINVQGIGTDVNKPDTRPTQRERISGRNKGKGGHNNLVPRLEIAQHGGHVQRGAPRMRQEHPLRAEFSLHPRIALFRKDPVSGQMATLDGLGDIVQLLTDNERSVEWNDAQWLPPIAFFNH